MTATVGPERARPACVVTATEAEEEEDMDIVTEKIHVLRDMAADEHVAKAYRPMATDHSDTLERQAINASLAVAHLLLAELKSRQ